MLRLPDPLFFLPFIVFDLMLLTQIDCEKGFFLFFFFWKGFMLIWLNAWAGPLDYKLRSSVWSSNYETLTDVKGFGWRKTFSHLHSMLKDYSLNVLQIHWKLLNGITWGQRQNDCNNWLIIKEANELQHTIGMKE